MEFRYQRVFLPARFFLRTRSNKIIVTVSNADKPRLFVFYQIIGFM
jgi:hypothetical protein